MQQMATRPGYAGLDRNWAAVAASAVCLIFSTGTLQLYSFGVFVRPLSTEFGWSRTGMSGAVAISQYALGLAAPMWGLLIDRYGPRAVVLPCVVVLALLIASLSLLTPQLWLFYLLFALVPFLAGAESPIGHAAVMVRQFDRRLGFALGLALMGVGLGAAVLPPLAQTFVDDFGWRAAYVALGVLTLVVTFPAALVATRHARGPAAPRTGADRAEFAAALRTPTFALMCAAFVLLGTVSVGMLPHLVPLLTDHGITPVLAARIAGLTGLATVIGRGGLGWVLDRVHAPYVLAVIAVLLGCGFMILAYGEGAVMGGLGAMLLGLALGAELDLMSFLVRRYFGQALFGRMYGLIFGLYLLGAGTGPLLLGISFDRLGGYPAGLVVFAALAVVAALLGLAMPSYAARRDAEGSAPPMRPAVAGKGQFGSD